MKKKQTEQTKMIPTKEAGLLEKLISSAKEKYSIKDIVFYFLDSINYYKDRKDIVEQLLFDKDIKEELKDKLQSEMLEQGIIILKVDSLDKKSKLDDFIKTEIFPYYNEQQQNIFN